MVIQGSRCLAPCGSTNNVWLVCRKGKEYGRTHVTGFYESGLEVIYINMCVCMYLNR